ncbi:lipase chaperone [Alcanivorax hongdengensis A-11-3]|uniref:Lipase chaperone n=1 Tax=Alcanivorax hongdengensis A-11-3 TaxID=1177179 RepID=L0W8T8_9GAMM|nr:lipase secretion chaperone [Alcanivorax hongdengensis]EKF73143.1 lipase chaperone [Alcanivorax hongdengensis A-11-3]
MGSPARRSLRYAVPAFLLITALALWLLKPEPEQPGAAAARSAPTGTLASAASASATPGSATHFVTGLETLPASLEGTRVPDGLQVDADGNLVINAGIRDVFDYFLTTLGEEDLATVVARMRAYLASQLPAGAADQANRILDGYLAWRDNLSTIPQAGGVSAEQLDLNAVRAQQQAVADSCQQYMDGTVCQAFFARQTVRDDYAINRLAVLRDDSLSADQKARRIAALTASLPAPMQEEISEVTRYQALRDLTAQSREEGQDDAALHQIREQLVGPQATSRLETLDAKRQQFNQRVDQWLTQRAALLANTDLSEADRDAQVAALREQQFTDQEAIRVKARERIADQQH